LDKFCSGQSYPPHIFGPNCGFVDHTFIASEEEEGGRLVVLDSVNRDLYQLSGLVGHYNYSIWSTNSSMWGTNNGNGGMPFALIDTGTTDYIALVLSSNGGSKSLQLYIGMKRFTQQCQPIVNGDLITPSFLKQNGLACEH
jgi:hypothetical protein